MTQGGKIEVDEVVIHTSVLDFLRCGGKRYILQLGKFETLMVSTGYVP